MHRTLLVTRSYAPSLGGIERYLQTLASDLYAPDLTVITSPHERGPSFDATAPYRIIRRDLLTSAVIRPSWLRHLPWFFRTTHRLKIGRIVFGHYASFVSLGYLTKLIFGIPYSITFHGLDFLSYRVGFFRRIFLKMNIRSAEWIIVNSSYTFQLLYKFGVPKGKLVVARPGIEPLAQPTADSINDFRQRHAIPSQRSIITVARLVKRKGHATVLRAMPEILSAVPGASYLVVGDGPERLALRRLADSLGIASHVRFLGPIDDEQRSLAIAASSLFIMTPVSTAHDIEGFGIAYVEALAAGIPIVTTKSAGVIDIIRDGYNGRELDENASPSDVAQVVVSLLRNPERAEELGKNSFFDARQRFTRTLQTDPFKKILATPPGTRAANPAVSVIVPTWNSGETLAKTLNSILMQTWKDLEIIVVDDGSIDHPETVCAHFPSVQLVRKEHAGAPSARNFGARIAQGALLLFCDADVTMHPRMIERMVTTLLVRPSASYAYCSFRFGWRTFDLFDFDADRLKRSNYISMMSLIRREAFEPMDESVQRLQDWDLWLTLLEHNHIGTWVPARLFSATVGKHGISKGNAVPPEHAVRNIREKHHLN